MFVLARKGNLVTNRRWISDMKLIEFIEYPASIIIRICKLNW
jgi:hypothetical protein